MTEDRFWQVMKVIVQKSGKIQFSVCITPVDDFSVFAYPTINDKGWYPKSLCEICGFLSDDIVKSGDPFGLYDDILKRLHLTTTN